jgi:hypothetical protein
MARTILASTLAFLMLASGAASATEDSTPLPEMLDDANDVTEGATAGQPAGETVQEVWDLVKDLLVSDGSGEEMTIELDAQAVEDAATETAEAAQEAATTVTDAAQDVAGQALSAVRSLDCTQAIKVERTWYGGTVTDRREETRTWIRPHTFVFVEETRLPVYRTVQTTVAGALPDEPAAAASALLGAVPIATAPATDLGTVRTETTRVLDHWTTIRSVEHVTRDITLRAHRDAAFVDWEPYVHTFYINAILGAPYVAAGLGEPIEVCGAGLMVLDHEPDPDWQEAEMRCLCLRQPADGWRTQYAWVDVWLTTPQDALDFERDGWSWSRSLRTLFQDGAEGLRPLLFGPADPQYVQPDEAVDMEGQAASAAAGARLAGGAMNVGALSILGIAALGGIAYAARRRFR